MSKGRSRAPSDHRVDTRSLAVGAAVFLAWSVPLTLIVFLLMSRFFVGWSGTITSVRPYQPEDAARLALVVADDGSDTERWLPTAALTGLPIPVSAYAAPPATLPPEAPRTSKSRWTLSMVVVPAGGAASTHTTTSPQALALALLVFIGSLALRNMAVSGSPARFGHRDTVLPAALPTAGQPTGPPKQRPRKTAPPPRRRKR